MEYVITFRNTNYAIKAEQCLLEESFHVSVMPLPSEIRAGCGICLRVPTDEMKAAIKLLAENNIDQIELFSRVTSANKFVYNKIESEHVLWDENSIRY